MTIDPQELENTGFAHLGALLSTDECAAIRTLYDDDARFRSRVVMARHNFGLGEYKYFADPLPPVVHRLRETLYAQLVPIANNWLAGLRLKTPYPPSLDEFLERCAIAGQRRPTPLVLRYDAGGYNCLHQDLYGELAFPLQVVVALSEPGTDYTGGELVLVEQRPRMQSRPHVIRMAQGEAVVIATNERPVAGRTGPYRVKMRHGVSTVLSGTRYSLGIIFHNAQ